MGSVVEDVLEHAGVKGMKWGVRKDKGSGGENSRDLGNVKNLSDDDLKKLVARMRLEQDFKTLTSKPPDKGKEFRKQLINDGKKTLFKIAIAATVGKIMQEVLGDRTDAYLDKRKRKSSSIPGNILANNTKIKDVKTGSSFT